MLKTIITGTGSYIPTVVKTNEDFSSNSFYMEDQTKIDKSSSEISEKFEHITGIKERRYASEELNTSAIGAIAAKLAIEDSAVDVEALDQIIVAHNFGDVKKDNVQSDLLPALASRIKHELGIKNPRSVAYDILFGCPGWIQGLIQADAFIKSGMAKKCLVIGTETLSRVIDPHDRDSMIFSDGAGACVVEAKNSEYSSRGIMGTSALSHCENEAYYLHFGKSNLPDSDPNTLYIKMNGRKVYEYGLKHVPDAMKECLEKSNVTIDQVKKIFIHQANEKLDEAIITRFFKLFDIDDIPKQIMPMSIHRLGNSSVATVPTLLDLVRKGKLQGHSLQKDDVILLASVGSGMNINAVCYRV